jgi:hypothetical protein
MQVDQAHQVRRADAVTRLLLCRVDELAGEEVGGLARDREQVALAGRGMMHARGGHEVAHVVHLEVHRIGEAFLVFAGAAGDLDVGVDVAVGVLCARDEVDVLVELGLQPGIALEREDGGCGFDPLLEVAVVPFGASMPLVRDAASGFKIADELEAL